jgi:hypothetical protein
VWEMFLHAFTEKLARWGGFAHQKSDGRDWNVRANMCHVQGMLKSDKKKVSWSCHRPYSPTACEMGSSVSSSSPLGLPEVWLGAGPLRDIASVIGAAEAEINRSSALQVVHKIENYVCGKENLEPQLNLSAPNNVENVFLLCIYSRTTCVF